jgi:hypothetical protein
VRQRCRTTLSTEPHAQVQVRRHTLVRACTRAPSRQSVVQRKDSDWEIGRERVGRMKPSGYMCPSLRRVSIPRPSSCARPERSAIVVVRNSVMICGMVVAQEGTVPVHGTQPRLR